MTGIETPSETKRELQVRLVKSVAAERGIDHVHSVGWEGTQLEGIALSTWALLNTAVKDEDRIPRRRDWHFGTQR
jgi:hypothetical protein